MKRQIRTSVWETNSSSVHTLVINPEGLSPNELKMKDGYVIADFGQFGTDYRLYKSQDDKLSYLLTELYYINGYDENIEENWDFEHIVQAIQKHDSKVLGVKIEHKVDPEIDHQSVPEYGQSKFVNYWDEESIINFIFNKHIWFSTDCD